QRCTLGEAELASYWGIVDWARSRNFRFVDFGPCRAFVDDGIFFVKASWGMKIRPEWRLPFDWTFAWKKSSPPLRQLFNRLGFVVEKPGGLHVAAFAGLGEKERLSLQKRALAAGLAGIEELSWA